MYPILLRIGGFELRTYGVVVALAALTGYFLARREAARRGLGARTVEDFGVVAVVAGILGARLYYLAFADPEVLIHRPWEVLALWKGGLAIHGALLGILTSAVLFCRLRRVPFWGFADALTPGLILGQGIGRLACLLNGDAYGLPTDLPWGITFTDPEALAPLGIPLHPTQLYEMGLDLALFAVIWKLRDRRLSPGQLFFVYAGGYGAIRFVVEAFRGDQLRYAGGISAAQTISAVAVVASLVAFRILRSHAPVGRREDGYSVAGGRPVVDGSSRRSFAGSSDGHTEQRGDR